jgi:prepilin-type N-terminal cleavage/methylation domain-containing protein
LRNSTLRRARGFTLIEIIITLVVLAIAGTMLAVFMGPGITRVADPLTALQNDASLQMVMENMIARASATDMATLKTEIGASGANQTNAFSNNAFAYRVDRNSYCALDSGTNTFTDSASVTDYLCVTITLPNQPGSKISYLFTE